MNKIGLVYFILCEETGNRYIGSTFEPTVAKRMTSHRCKSKFNCSSNQIIERNNYSYGLLETVEVTSRDELRMCERKWYEKLPNINKRNPFILKEEQKEKKKEYSKKYYEENKEKYKEYQQIYKLNRKMEQKVLSQVPLEVPSS